MNKEEYTAIVATIENGAFRLAKSILHDEADAEDVVQDVLEQMWRQRERLATVGNPEGYLLRAVRNRALDKLKLSRLRAQHNQEAHYGEEGLTHSESGFDIRDLLEGFVARLPEQQQTILHLRDVEGYEFDTIGEIVGLEAGAVRVALSRARKEIRRKLEMAMSYGTR